MTRAFEEHVVRKVKSLSGAWRFSLDETDTEPAKGAYKPLKDGETVIVPSVCQTELGLLNATGVARYEKHFFTEGGTLRFVFESAMTEAEVFLDGEHLGGHYGGFTAFDFIVRDVPAGEHTLTVYADSRFDEHSIPQEKVDWFSYCGIARDVSVERLAGISVLSCHLKYTLSDELTSAEVSAVLELYNADGMERSAPVSVSVGDDTIYENTITLSAGERTTVTTPAVKIEGIRLWSTEEPNLYRVTARSDTDDLIDRIGFRKIEAKGGAIRLNGKQLELRGVNRHEEHPEWGFAFPPKLMKRDLDLIRDLGCNTVRGSHYPNSKLFLDLLDERGVLFWSEIPIWGCGFSEEALGDPVILERGLEMHREMVGQYYNHPSIIIWGMHNEIPSNTKNAYEMTRRYSAFLRNAGGNRLVTHASNHPLDDICFEFDDILCLNQYYGWYNGNLKSWDHFLEAFRARREALGRSDVPVIISEFGAAALYGYRDTFNATRWSEEFQSELLKYCLERFHGDPMIAGFYIWQFCNIRTSLEMGLNRARTFNNKGILDEYRNPKAAYFEVKTLYKRFETEEWGRNETDHNS